MVAACKSFHFQLFVQTRLPLIDGNSVQCQNDGNSVQCQNDGPSLWNEG
jgi:hypothetical protein